MVVNRRIIYFQWNGVFTEHERGSTTSVLLIHILALGYEVGEDVCVAQHGRQVDRLAALRVTRVQAGSSGHWKQGHYYW